ncbi:MAG: quinolinate synthase NadA [Myxococcales bacterium]|nr:quinolinate synthase NadA [Myxococcales bacterium]
MTTVAPNRASETDTSFRSSEIRIRAGMPICQTDLPLDWYQEEFKVYAEEYLALRDRTPETVLPWMDRYIQPALDHFGDSLLLLAHYYMGGEIVKLVERYGGTIADSYVLALQAVRNPQSKTIVESAVHFMAESIAILAHPDQAVYITNPKAGCTMEMLAKEWMVEPLFDELRDRFGDDLLVVTYMNTSGRLKALSGLTGGATCTSSNARIIVDWALKQGKKVLFLPDEHLGDNVAGQLGIGPQGVYRLPGGQSAMHFRVDALSSNERDQLDGAQMLLFGSYCGVHMVFRPEHVEYWRALGYRVLVHPECRREVVEAADGAGSTAYLWREMLGTPSGGKLAIATEGHFVRNAKEQAAMRGVEVVNLADVPGADGSFGCGCATMSRNDPPHLVALLDLLRRGNAPAINRVLPGDNVDERTGWRERLDASSRSEIARLARLALEKMIELTESAGG